MGYDEDLINDDSQESCGHCNHQRGIATKRLEHFDLSGWRIPTKQLPVDALRLVPVVHSDHNIVVETIVIVTLH